MWHKIIMHVVTDKVPLLMRVGCNIFHKTIELLFKFSLLASLLFK